MVDRNLTTARRRRGLDPEDKESLSRERLIQSRLGDKSAEKYLEYESKRGFSSRGIQHGCDVYRYDLLDADFIIVPPGEYMMGPVPVPTGDEPEPQDRRIPVVVRKSFLMGKHAVTQEEWKRIFGHNPSRFEGDARPVEQVSWVDCQVFLDKLNRIDFFLEMELRQNQIVIRPPHELHGMYVEADDSEEEDEEEARERDLELVAYTVIWRDDLPRYRLADGSENGVSDFVFLGDIEDLYKLWRRSGKGWRMPSEAEWEYACRAGTETRFPSASVSNPGNGGDDVEHLKKIAVFNRQSNEGHEPCYTINGIGNRIPTREPNDWGFCHMLGNVWEWCGDHYHDLEDPSRPPDERTWDADWDTLRADLIERLTKRLSLKEDATVTRKMILEEIEILEGEGGDCFTIPFLKMAISAQGSGTSLSPDQADALAEASLRESSQDSLSQQSELNQGSAASESGDLDRPFAGRSAGDIASATLEARDSSRTESSRPIEDHRRRPDATQESESEDGDQSDPTLEVSSTSSPPGPSEERRGHRNTTVQGSSTSGPGASMSGITSEASGSRGREHPFFQGEDGQPPSSRSEVAQPRDLRTDGQSPSMETTTRSDSRATDSGSGSQGGDPSVPFEISGRSAAYSIASVNPEFYAEARIGEQGVSCEEDTSTSTIIGRSSTPTEPLATPRTQVDGGDSGSQEEGENGSDPRSMQTPPTNPVDSQRSISGSHQPLSSQIQEESGPATSPTADASTTSPTASIPSAITESPHGMASSDGASGSQGEDEQSSDPHPPTPKLSSPPTSLSTSCPASQSEDAGSLSDSPGTTRGITSTPSQALPFPLPSSQGSESVVTEREESRGSVSGDRDSGLCGAERCSDPLNGDSGVATFLSPSSGDAERASPSNISTQQIGDSERLRPGADRDGTASGSRNPNGRSYDREVMGSALREWADRVREREDEGEDRPDFTLLGLSESSESLPTTRPSYRSTLDLELHLPPHSLDLAEQQSERAGTDTPSETSSPRLMASMTRTSLESALFDLERDFGPCAEVEVLEAMSREIYEATIESDHDWVVLNPDYGAVKKGASYHAFDVPEFEGGRSCFCSRTTLKIMVDGAFGLRIMRG